MSSMSNAPVFAVSDIHGHVDDLRAAVTEAGLADAHGDWTGDDAELWVLGDMLDRGPDGVGVIDLVMRLEHQAPGQVHALLGNHELMTLGMKLCGSPRFELVFRRNGGLESDQRRLTDEHIDWLLSRPVLGVRDRDLFMHSDTRNYLEYGGTVGEINDAVRQQVETRDEDTLWEVFASLSSRYEFTGEKGADVAGELCTTLDVDRLVHGHTIIASLLNVWSADTVGPLAYCDGRALAIDGGRYDGGPLLVVRLA